MAILNYKLTADNSNFKKGMNEALGATKGLDSAIGGIQSKLFALAATYISFDFLKDSANAFMESETAADNLAQAVGANGGLASDFEELNNQAENLSVKGVFDDEDIKMAQALGLQYGITTTQMKSLTPTILDWAARMKKSPVEAMEAVAKGMKSQSKELGKMGIEYDKTKTAAGNLAIIQGVLNGKYKDSDQTIAETTESGKLDNLRDQYDGLQEVIGEGLNNAFMKVAPYLSEFLSWAKESVSWLFKNSNEILVFSGIITSGLVTAFIILNTQLGISKIELAFVTGQIFLQTLASEGLAAAFTAIGISATAAWAAATLGLSLVIAGLYAAYKSSAEFKGFLWGFVAGAKELFVGLGDLILGAFTFNPQKMAQGLSEIANVGKAFSKGKFEGMKDFYIEENKKKKALTSPVTKYSKTGSNITQTPAQKETVKENITINITKLVEKLEVSTVNLKEGSDEIKRIIAATLQEAVYSIKLTQ